MENKVLQDNKLHPITFSGTNGGYFSIWLVNLLLTIVTLGIYSAWATVRRRRYFYGNTELNGDRFDYHAEPIQILKGRLLVIACVVLFYVLLVMAPVLSLLVFLAFMGLMPWLIIRSWRYNAIMTGYRGVRFNYLCQTGRAYWVLLFCPLLLILGLYAVILIMMIIGASAGSPSVITAIIAISAVFLVPLLAVINGIMATLQQDFYVNNLSFGNTSFIATLKKSAFIKISLISTLIFMPFFVVAIILACSFFARLFQLTLLGDVPESMLVKLMVQSTGSLLWMMGVLLVGSMIANSYRIVAQRNYLFSQTTLQGEIKLHSSMRFWPYLSLWVTNSLIKLGSLGLATPVAEVRHARYLADSTAIEGDLSLLNVQPHEETAHNAFAEEAVQILDLGVSC